MGMKLWKGYFFLMCLFFILIFFGLIYKPKLVGIVEELFNLITLVALYGFCFKRLLVQRMFWKIMFFSAVLFEIVYVMLEPVSAPSLNVMVVAYVVALILTVPVYIAMYLYAFKRNDIWGDEVPSK